MTKWPATEVELARPIVAWLRDGGLVAAAPDTPVKTELVQDLEGVTSELVFFFEGGFLVLAEGQALACFCLDRDEVRA